jgi:hypothetical protein
MKVQNLIISFLIVCSLMLSGCATIIGGSNYNAHIVVVDNPNARITYKGEVVGTGSAVVKVNRTQANKFAFSVKQEGYGERIYNYNSRSFRGWAFVGSVLLWTGMYNGIPLPWGVAVDLATGALWKPNVMEQGVSKDDYKNFRYRVSYGDSTAIKAINAPQQSDLIYLKNGSRIKGQIVEQIIGSTIKIKTQDGSLFVFKSDEVEKIARE